MTKTGPRSSSRFFFGLLSIIIALILLALACFYFQAGFPSRALLNFGLMALSALNAFNLLRQPKMAETEPSGGPSVPSPPPLLATIALVAIGAGFFSLALLGLIGGAPHIRNFLLIMAAVSGTSIALLVWNYLKLSKKYRQALKGLLEK